MTPIHVRARPGDVAPVVLLVGDPGRATRTAELMHDASCYNEFRGLLGYTGTFEDVRLSVQTTGMGCPSAAIVCEELAMLGARVLIRLGTCGAVQPDMRATDIVIATAACPARRHDVGLHRRRGVRAGGDVPRRASARRCRE